MKLSAGTKLLYGLGFSSQGIKDGLFQVFLFFYFTQILGLDPALTGASTLIALMFDAVSDPLVGVISDGWKSKKWGRRHPFMFLSALPLGLFIWLLFLPPEGLGQSGLFLWMTGFTILVRLSLTLFIVPAMSLGAELSTDYEERTSITSYRIMFGALMATVTIVIGFAVYFVPTAEYERGLMNAAAYPKFAMLSALLIIATIVISTWGTRKQIPRLQAQNTSSKRITIKQLFSNIGNMVKLKSFNSIVFYTMVVYVGVGVGVVFTTYFMEYYFQLSATEMIALPMASGLGGILALMLAGPLAKRFDKKATVVMCTILFAFFFSAPYNLRLLGLFPENGDSNLIYIYFMSVMGGYIFLWIVLSLVNSMMADVVDEYELKTQQRDEGLFFATLSFAYKMTVGVGYFVAGILLKWINFPAQTAVQNVPTEAIAGLGKIGGPLLMGIYLISIVFIVGYPIDKARYAEIRGELDGRKYIEG